ncbi:MAG: hypothetical protein ACRD8W_29405 [Nitrososphaeraceae archaeon]
MSESVFIGVTVGLLAIIVTLSHTIMVSDATIEQNSTSANLSGFILPSGQSSHFLIPPDDVNAALKHINNAQTALQNGDTEGANNHLELAKQSINPNWEKNERPYNSDMVKPVSPDIATR